ncbi:aconitate hydratase [Geomesophilobacter sediminis]|uniref:Aconitate hydratase A n=1 Tax=Geomesophilobacter sediminis TaxID=2798584 RepID=A0A8J7J7D7_9BACT|nr:aconitate hydratase [Geomesophilobacter sediminis]MBJ6725081.1 aconitate hydratase [Geomesophilobacter sediminis]
MPFPAADSLTVAGSTYRYFPLAGVAGSERLPYSLKVLLENLLRHGNEEGVVALQNWDPAEEPTTEISFTPARVLMQDFTGVPCMVDLATMRDAMQAWGGDPGVVNPLAPVELIIDHSIIAERFGTPDAFRINADIEFDRNQERYRFLRWAQQAFANVVVVPPNTGICHQVNLEYLARGVMVKDGVAFPDTLVGTDSHTTMINGLGVLGWGVGGIEAEAAMLGQPVAMLIPKVVGFKLHGALPAGTTATDLVLTVTEMLRRHGVVGKFVEFYGPGIASIAVADRATIGNMSPEYGSTAAIFPVDEETTKYLRLTGRSEEQIRLVEAYYRAQGMWHDPAREPLFTEKLELDLASVQPALAGPRRPQDRVPLAESKKAWRCAISSYVAPPPPETAPAAELEPGGIDEASAESFPASDAAAAIGEKRSDLPHPALEPAEGLWPHQRVRARIDGTEVELDHGSVVIAAITSCTNTSNPDVMLAAALLARNAVRRGLQRKPWVKTTLAPGSKVVMEYYEKGGVRADLERLGFNLVGYGCTTCIGNSGPLIPEVSEAVKSGELAVVSVLSGNRNFEGRINPEVKMNYLASPPLVVAYALAGTMDFDFATEPLGEDAEGKPVYLAELWPTAEEVRRLVSDVVAPELFSQAYGDLYLGEERWRDLAVPEGRQYQWGTESTYIRRPPYFDGVGAEPAAIGDIVGGRVLARLGDSVTTDHISPAGSIKPDSPAGRYLSERGVPREDFNSYGSRRGNHEVMIRGTFANIRLRNALASGQEGGVTRYLPDGSVISIFDAAERYRADGVPLLIIAGKEYGSGSSRDWAAKGTMLLGVRAVLAESFERIHRSNLIGMGILPLQFLPGESAASLGLTGEETYTIREVANVEAGSRVNVQADAKTFQVQVRIDTPTETRYFRNGGILPYVLRNLRAAR